MTIVYSHRGKINLNIAAFMNNGKRNMAIPRARNYLADKNIEEGKKKNLITLKHQHSIEKKKSRKDILEDRINLLYAHNRKHDMMKQWEELKADAKKYGEDDMGHIDVHCSVVQRRALWQIAQHQVHEGGTKKQFLSVDDQLAPRKRRKSSFMEFESRFVKFAMEHGVLLQILILLPLATMFVYIVFVEEGPLFTVVNNNGSNGTNLTGG